MANLINKDITDVGRILIADVQAGAVLVPTKIVMGSGSLPPGKTVQSMTSVITPVMEISITKKERKSDGRAIFGGTYQNNDISEAFFYREIALFCKAEYRDGSGNVIRSVPECLYLYGNFGEYADLIPAYGGETTVERNIDLVTWVGGVNATIEMRIESGIYVSYDALNKEIQKCEPKTKAVTVTLAAAGWVDHKQTVNIPGVGIENPIIPGADPSSHIDYHYNGVRPVEQGPGTLTFACESVPASDVLVNIMIFSPEVTV